MARDVAGRTTTIRKIRALAGIHGNERADNAAKRVVAELDSLPPELLTRHTIGATP